jgi:hypothetical protein
MVIKYIEEMFKFFVPIYQNTIVDLEKTCSNSEKYDKVDLCKINIV